MTLPDDDIKNNNTTAGKSSRLPSQHITFPPPSGNKIPREAWKVLAILSSIEYGYVWVRSYMDICILWLCMGEKLYAN
ncbi:MAG: hypothetical protein WBZ36_23145 [Candidatus Nitrosopolaris sp.]